MRYASIIIPLVVVFSIWWVAQAQDVTTNYVYVPSIIRESPSTIATVLPTPIVITQTVVVTVLVTTTPLPTAAETETSTLTTTPTLTPSVTTTSTATSTVTSTPIQVVAFDSPGQTVNEGVGIVSTTVRLSSPIDTRVLVFYTVSGSATNPADYSMGSGIGVLIFSANQTTATVSFSVVQDTEVEQEENIEIVLHTPDLVELGEPSLYTVTILDDDQ